jgi:hypothetical protein
MKKFEAALQHALLMVRRNRKSYALLSVTITLSFSFLLAFFVFSDSQIYNRYKEIFRVPPTVAEVFGSSAGFTSDSPIVTGIKYSILRNWLDQMSDTQFFEYCYYQIGCLDYYSDEDQLVNVEIYFIPHEHFGFYIDGAEQFGFIESLSGKPGLSEPGEVLINEYFYNLLDPDPGRNPTVVLPLPDKNKGTRLKEFRVAGVVSNPHKNVSLSVNGVHYVKVYASIDLIKECNFDYLEKRILINTDHFKEVVSFCRNLGVDVYSSYEYHLEAMEEIKNRLFLKGITAFILFLLLGINLYSSFNNALKERHFEIGVKRALGAGEKDILNQFFFEGIIVMLVNIVLSVFIVLNLSVFYKLIQRVIFSNQWTIYITLHSIILFIASVLFLSFSFSLIFAYQSTRVEIVKHLKSEG